MAEAYIGEIRIFAGNFAPRDWALCDGQLMPISVNTSLFSILGTTYGGDGKTTFALPDLRGSAPIHFGGAPGLTPWPLGQRIGEATVSLLESEIPPHTHAVNAKKGSGQEMPDSQTVWSLTKGRPGPPAYTDAAANTVMHTTSLSPTGGSVPHNNRQPYTGLNFIICLVGEFPPRS
jgi:microcystin-dependent protein